MNAFTLLRPRAKWSETKKIFKLNLVDYVILATKIEIINVIHALKYSW
jgi:hypothetical protein